MTRIKNNFIFQMTNGIVSDFFIKTQMNSCKKYSNRIPPFELIGLASFQLFLLLLF